MSMKDWIRNHMPVSRKTHIDSLRRTARIVHDDVTSQAATKIAQAHSAVARAQNVAEHYRRVAEETAEALGRANGETN
jgi:hypothetical protein